MAEPNDFANSPNPKTTTTTVTKVHYDYAFGDLPAGTTLEMKLNIPGQASQTKTLGPVPANKTGKDVVLNLDGFIV